MPLTRVWKLYEHWKKQPPVHVLLAMFLDYGGGEASERAPAKKPGFDFSPPLLAAFGGMPRPQSELHPTIRSSVEQLQAHPKYIAWRESVKSRQSSGG
jgi:hypothetical protein